MLENTFASSLHFSFLSYTQIKGLFLLLLFKLKKSSSQILVTSAYIPELMRKCPGIIVLLAEHSCFEDVEHLFKLFRFFLVMLLVFQRIQKQNNKSEFRGTLHLLSEHTLFLLLSLLLFVFLFYSACL